MDEPAAPNKPFGMTSMANLFIRALMTGVVLVLVIAPDATRIARAQPYCAVYNSGTQNCGIPTLQSCEQSVSGVGGICQPDNTAQLRPDFFSRRRLQQAIEGDNPSSGENNPPGGPDFMPPPPDE
jgi:hypothetical protein